MVLLNKRDDLHKEKVISLPHPKNPEYSQHDRNRMRLSTWRYETRIKKKSLYKFTHLAPLLHYEITEKFNKTNRKEAFSRPSKNSAHPRATRFGEGDSPRFSFMLMDD
jgi:hypothetical protein